MEYSILIFTDRLLLIFFNGEHFVGIVRKLEELDFWQSNAVTVAKQDLTCQEGLKILINAIENHLN